MHTPTVPNNWYPGKFLDRDLVWSLLRTAQRKWFIEQSRDQRAKRCWRKIIVLLNGNQKEMNRAIHWTCSMQLWNAVSTIFRVNKKGVVCLAKDYKHLHFNGILSILKITKLAPAYHIVHQLYNLNYLNKLLWLAVGDRNSNEIPYEILSKLIDKHRVMKFIPGGIYNQGTPTYVWYYNARPRHQVKLDPFEMSVFPVTQALYFSVTNKNPSFFTGVCRPVENVTWYDAIRFCNRLSRIDSLNPVYRIGAYKEDAFGREITPVTEYHTHNGYRLPSEAEWECAASANKYYFFSGSDMAYRVAWYKRNSQNMTHLVGLKRPNDWGFF